MICPLLLKRGEPEEPPSVTPCPFAFADQDNCQCDPEAEPHEVLLVEPLKVEIFLMSPAVWCIPAPPFDAELLAFHPFQ